MAYPIYGTPGILPSQGQGGGMSGGLEGLLGGGNPLFNMGLGILANNYGNYGNAGVAIGRGAQQGMQQSQQYKQFMAQNALANLQLQKAQQEMEQKKKRDAALPRLLGGNEAYTSMQETPVTTSQNMPIPAAEGAQAPNFGLQRQDVTTMQQSPVFDQKQYTQDLIDSGYGDDLLKRKLLPAAPELMFAPDGTAINKNDPSLIGKKFEKAEDKKPPANVQEYEFAVKQGFPGTFLDFQLAQKKAGASNTNVSVSTGQKGFDNTLKLRGDFRSEPIYKAHQDVKSAYSQISTALKQNSPAGDLAGATKLMKILDPGSVVRESELGMAMSASGALDRLYNYADMITRGTKLTPTQRKDFQTLADGLYKESSNQYNAKRQEYQGIAERNELNVTDVLGDPDTISRPKPAKPPMKGQVVDGYKFRGGNPADPANWEKK
jgi:hypothetical protein